MPPKKKATETNNVYKVTPFKFDSTTETIEELITVMPTLSAFDNSVFIDSRFVLSVLAASWNLCDST